MAASVATRSSFIIHSKNPQIKGYYSLKMKQNASAGSTAVFDFDEGDPEPYYVKKNRFYGFFSKGKNCSEISEENAKSTCKDQAQSLMNERNMAAKQSITYQSSSFSDDIETDDSDSESNQARRQLDIRFRDMHGDSSPGLLMDENVMIDGAREVIIQGEELYFSNKKYIGPEFTFTADAVQLRTKAFRAIKWPLLCINSFGFGCDQTGQPWMEINLSKNGVEWFLQHLGCLDSCSDTVYSRISDDYSCYEQQITSLSDVYKTIWRPWKEIAQDNYKDSIFIQRERTRDILCDWCDLVYPTEDDLDAVTVTKHDYLLLEPDQFLSDTIIDFYIKYLQTQLSEVDKRRFYFYNSFFFRKLTEANKNLQCGSEKCKSAFESVKRWTAKINILDKDYLFIPIMLNAHWSLVIICHPGNMLTDKTGMDDVRVPLILHLDSLEGYHSSLEEPIRSYLVEEWRERNSRAECHEVPQLRFAALKVPQQTNFSDCGLFLLHYVELFIHGVLEKNTIDFVSHMWFNPVEVSRKRARIQSLIQDLKANRPVANCLKDQQLTETYAVRPSHTDQWQAPSSYDISNITTTFKKSPYNSCEQASTMLVSCRRGNGMQLNTHSRLGHYNAELGCMEVPGEAHQSISCCCQHACDEVNSCCQIKETEETQNMQSVARFNAHAESTHLMQDVDMSSGGTIAGDDLEVSHDTLNKNKHSVVECIIGLVSSSNNELHRKEEHHMPDSLLKNNTDASFGKPLCSLNDDRKTLVAGITEPISNEKDVIRKISSVCDEPAHGTQGLCRNFEESSKIIDSVKDLEGQLTNLVDKEKAIRNDFKGGITRLSIDDGVEGNTACSDGTAEVIDGITSMSTLSNVGSLHMKECHLTMVNVEHGASVSNMECSQSCATDTDGSHCVPSTMDIQNQEIEVKANQKRKKQPEFPSPVRRITRSSAKRKYGT